MADLIASEYHWSRECIWWECDFGELAWYLQAIVHRKKAENGESAATATDEMAELYEVIEQVKAEKQLTR